MVDYTDNFDRANESPLASPWATPGRALFLSANHVINPDDSADDQEYYNNTFSNDQYSQAEITSDAGYSTGNGPAVITRCADAAVTLYRCVVNQAGSNNIELRKFSAGASTLIADYTAAYSAAAVLRLESRGTTHTIKYNGNTVASPTDATIASGKAGLAYSSEGGAKASSMDNWGGGDIAATAAVTGTATPGITEADVVAGGKTIITTLTGDTFIADTVPTAAFSAGTAKSTTTAPGRASTGDIVATFPATPTVGQFGIIICYLDQGTASINSPGSPAQVWNLVTGAPWGTNTPKLYIWTRVMLTGDVAPTITIAGAGVNDSSVVNVAFYDGIDSVVTIGAATSSTGTPSTAAQITGSAIGNIILGIIARGDNESASGQTFGGSGTGVAERLDGGTDQGNDSQISMADKTLVATGATGGLSVTTAATDPYIGIILELGVATNSPYKVAALNLWAPLLDSAQSEANGWDATVKPALAASHFVRTSATVTTITLPAVASYDITAQETITDTVPAGILTGGAQIVATPTFTIDAQGLFPRNMARYRRSPRSVIRRTIHYN